MEPGRQCRHPRFATQNQIATLGSIAPGTSPSVAKLSDGRSIVAWADPTNHVDWYNGSLYTEIQFATWPGTSPAVAMNDIGQWQIAATAADSRLWEITDFGNSVIETPSAVNGSPAITALSDGSFLMGYQASSGFLWVGTQRAPINTSVAPDTSPSITANSNGGWEAAFQGSDGHPVTVNSSGTITDIPVTMEPGTSPSITSVHH